MEVTIPKHTWLEKMIDEQKGDPLFEAEVEIIELEIKNAALKKRVEELEQHLKEETDFRTFVEKRCYEAETDLAYAVTKNGAIGLYIKQCDLYIKQCEETQKVRVDLAKLRELFRERNHFFSSAPSRVKK
jgi:hypothetical protein